MVTWNSGQIAYLMIPQQVIRMGNPDPLPPATEDALPKALAIGKELTSPASIQECTEVKESEFFTVKTIKLLEFAGLGPVALLQTSPRSL